MPFKHLHLNVKMLKTVCDYLGLEGMHKTHKLCFILSSHALGNNLTLHPLM